MTAKEQKAGKGARGRIRTWIAHHTVVSGIVLAVLCCICLCLVLYFTVFSDFSGSADFVYNHF